MADKIGKISVQEPMQAETFLASGDMFVNFYTPRGVLKVSFTGDGLQVEGWEHSGEPGQLVLQLFGRNNLFLRFAGDED